MERTPEYDQRVERDMRNRQAENFEKWYIQDKGVWYHKVEVDSILSALTCTKDDIILDAGSGTGRISLLIAPSGSAFDLCGFFNKKLIIFTT